MEEIYAFLKNTKTGKVAMEFWKETFQNAWVQW
jgi:hypothetical protein